MNTANNTGITALMMAASKFHDGMVDLLLEKGADPFSEDEVMSPANIPKRGKAEILCLAEGMHSTVLCNIEIFSKENGRG